MSRPRIAAPLCLILALLGLTFVDTASAAAATVTYNPTADAYVAKVHPRSNFGAADPLELRGSHGRRARFSYLKFRASVPTGSSVTGVTLRMYFSKVTTGQVFVNAAGSSWTERGITWNNKPAPGRELARVHTPTANGYYSIRLPVSSVVNGDNTFIVRQTNTKTKERFRSRENATLKPQLLVTTSTVTPPPPVAPTVTTGAASDVTDTAATLNGTVNPNGSPTTYQFQYGPTSSYGSVSPPVVPVPAGDGVADVSASTAISGLTADTLYHYRLVATNDVGTTYGDDATFTTASPPAAAPTVTTGSASDVTDTGATLNGTVNPNGSSTTYQFQYGPTSAYGSVSPVLPASAGFGLVDVPASTTISGLDADTLYHYRLVATNVAGTTNGADATFTTSKSSSGSCTGFGVIVSGNHLADCNGAAVQLRGVNRSGTQYACSEGAGIFDGPSDAASLAAMKTWHVNAVRVSLNDACWLGVNGVAPNLGGTTYQNAIKAYVDQITAAGMYAIVDLHFANPGTTLQPDQVPMADRDHANTFWAGVANAFKDNPAVMFDLFNEPYPDSNKNTTAAWTCVRDGGTCPGFTYTAAGSQEMLTAVRGTGATNVVLVGGPQYAGVVDNWTTYAPTDPAHQLAASIHIYFNTPASPDWSPCYLESCWTSTVAPLAATTPVVIGEVGEHDCSFGLIDGTSLSPAQDSLLTWADQHSVSYLAWAWFTGNCAGEPALINNYDGTATTYGAGYRLHLLLFP